MYQDGYVVEVEVNGKVVRSSALRGSGMRTIYLPYDTEYSLFIKNTNSKRVAVSINIDGTNILGNRDLVVGAYSSSRVDRFCLDGDLTRGNKLKFVRADGRDGTDPSNIENGFVSINFIPERSYLSQEVHPAIYFGPTSKGVLRDARSIDTMGGAQYSSIGGIPIGTTTACLGGTFASMAHQAEVGATVEGGRSNQVFSETYFEKEPLDYFKRNITFRILPEVNSKPTLTGRSFCVHCGKAIEISYKYCPHCGGKKPNV